MLLMGLEDEYARAIPLITANNFSLPAVRPLQVVGIAQLIVTEYQRAFLRNSHSLSGWPFVCLRVIHGPYFAR